MPEVVYRSEVQIERVKGSVRKAYLPAESESVIFSQHLLCNGALRNYTHAGH
jgi:hypothetical protein